MSLEDIKELLEKLELFPTLDSIGILLPYTNDEYLTSAFNIVYGKKYEQCWEEFEGRNEYDYICQILNFDISELNRNIDKFTQTELLYISKIINNALIGIEENDLTNRVIAILNEYKDIGTDKYIENIKIENFFDKYSINELSLIEIILSYNCEVDTNKYRDILNKVRKAKKPNHSVNQDIGIFSLLDKNELLSNDELNLFYELTSNASLYLSSVQDYSYVYEQMIGDFDINEYPVIAMYKLEESLLKELENRREENKEYTYNVTTK